MAFTKVAPAGIGSTPGDGYRIGDSFLHSTGVEITNINATGILTATSLDISGSIDFDGHTELDNLNVAGVSTFNDDVNVIQGKKINFGNTNGTQGHIYFDGSTTRLQTNHGLNIGSPVCTFKSANLAETMVEAIHNGAVKLWYDQSNHSTPKIQTTATGVTIDGTAVAGALDISGNIDVDGHTNLDNVSIAGIVTATDSSYHQYYALGSSTVGGIRFGNNTHTNGYIYYDNGANMNFHAAGSERLRITDDGFIGINEDDPKTGLTISKLGDYSTNDGNTYYIPVGKWSSAWNDINGLDNNTDYWVGFVGGYHKSGNSVNISLAPNRGNLNAQQGMYISGEATGTSSADFTVGKILGGSSTGQGTSGNVRATKSELFRIKNNGRVGIGTNTPLSGTHISDGTPYGAPQNSSRKATLTISAGSEGSADIQLLSANYNHIFFGDAADPNTGIIHYEHTGGGTDDMVFSTAGSQRLRIRSDGTVNIGSQTQPSSGVGKLNVKPSSPDSYFKIRNAADFDGTLTGNVIDNRTSDNSTSRDLIVRSMNLVLWQEASEKVRITNTGLVRIGGATANSADIDSTHTKLTIKQSANNKEDGIYIERSGERRGHYIYVGGALNQSDALCISTNQLGGDTDLLAIDRSGNIITGTGNVGINEQSPTNKLHISGTTGTSAGGLLRLDATTGDNFILFDNTNDSTEWAVGNDSSTRDEFRLYYNNGSAYTTQIVAIDGTHNNGVVTIDGGTTTLVKIKGDSAGTAGLRLGGDSGQSQCTGYVEVHQDENYGGGIFYNGDGSPSFATDEAADYFSLFRLSNGTRYSVMRWVHNSNDCNVQGNMYIDNGATSILRVTGDSSGTAGVSCGGDSGQTQCTGYVEVHQDQIHGGGISYNGDGSPSFASGETADHITFYRMNSGTRSRVFHYAYNSNTVNFVGNIQCNVLTGNSKNFRIPHPHPSKKDTHDLVHSSIEGPQCDNIYRGKVDLVGGTATVNIDTVSNMTDGTFVLLNRDIQCFTSNETGWTNVKGSVTGNLLTIIAQDDTCTDTISWMVVGERQDEGLKSEEVDTTDTYGKLIVELPKEA